MGDIMIFVWVGLAILLISVCIYVIIKLVPYLIVKIRKRKQFQKEKLEQECLSKVKIAKKGAIDSIDNETVELSENYKEVAYVPAKEQADLVDDSNFDDKSLDFEEFLKNSNRRMTVGEQIRCANPKMKAIMLSGVLQDKKF